MDELALKNHKPLRETAGAFCFAQPYASTCTPAARPRNRRTWATFQPAVTGKATAAASDVEQREPTSWARGRALAIMKLPTLKSNLPMVRSKHQTLQASAGATERTRGGKWQRIRQSVLRRDHYRCVDCGRIGLDNEVDHIVPLHRGGTDDICNLAVRCVPCHAAKSAAEAGQRAAGRGYQKSSNV